MSFYYYEDEKVGFGMPVKPKLYKDKLKTISSDGIYSCTYCAHTEKLSAGKQGCKRCSKEEWVKSINDKRVA